MKVAYQTSYSMGTFLISRFMGNQSEPPPIQQLLPDRTNDPESEKQCQSLYGVLKHRTLFLYKNESQIECVRVLLLPEIRVKIYPENVPDSEMYLRTNPIALTPKQTSSDTSLAKTLYLYAPTGSDKEDWFFMLRRSSKLSAYADSGALSTFYQEVLPMRVYTEAMQKLIFNTTHSATGSADEKQATAWLNALVGRAFVGLHSNPYIKDWVVHRLSRIGPHSQDDATSSFLGDIVIQDIHVGNSLPVLSNPRLVDIGVGTDMNVELDVDYTGGVRIEAATVASISVPAWDAYMKPISVPIVVAIKIKRFSARVLLKMKPFWETNRVWFGFYRQPELKLELEVEPIISNKLIKIQLVNQVIEKRIKEALEETVMLPNMDDFSFWPFEDFMGAFRYGSDDESDAAADDSSLDESDAEITNLEHLQRPEVVNQQTSPMLKKMDTETQVEIAKESQPLKSELLRTKSFDSFKRNINEIKSFGDETAIDAVISASLAGEAVETSMHGIRQKRSNVLLKPAEVLREVRKADNEVIDKTPPSINIHSNEVQEQTKLSHVFDGTSHIEDDNNSKLNKTPSTDSIDSASTSKTSHSGQEIKFEHTNYMEILGTAAYQLGHISREYGIDTRVRSIATAVNEYTKPAVTYAKEQSNAYKMYVKETATTVGLKAIDSLGLAPDKDVTDGIDGASGKSGSSDFNSETEQLQDRNRGTYDNADSGREGQLVTASSNSSLTSETNSISSTRRFSSTVLRDSNTNLTDTGNHMVTDSAQNLKTKPSRTFNVMGFNISTRAPSVPQSAMESRRNSTEMKRKVKKHKRHHKRRSSEGNEGTFNKSNSNASEA